MTTIFELVIGLLAVVSGIFSAWDAWREQRKQEARRQRWEALAAELDRYRAYFQGDFPKYVTPCGDDGPAGHFEIRRVEPATNASTRANAREERIVAI